MVWTIKFQKKVACFNIKWFHGKLIFSYYLKSLVLICTRRSGTSDDDLSFDQTDSQVAASETCVE